MIFDKKIKQIINDSLQLKEAFVSQEKKYDLKTEFLSDANKQNHIELYQNYIKEFNDISVKLDSVNKSEADSNNSDFRDLKVAETYNMNAIYLHELYFANISDVHSKITTDSLAFMRLERDFGSFDAWQKDFMACCKASQCGWAITYLNTYTRKYMNCSIDLHSVNVPFGSYPVIVMDVWQHAYYKDYLKDVKTYTTAMMKQLNWRVIEKRIKKADKVLEALKG